MQVRAFERYIPLKQLTNLSEETGIHVYPTVVIWIYQVFQ